MTPDPRGGVLRPARGGVLGSPFLPPEGQQLAPRLLRALVLDWRAWAVAGALLLFGQCFQYVVDVLPIYALTKAWPLLTLPLAWWACVRLALPYRAILLITIGWMIGVTPLIGIYELGDSIAAAVATTAKVWSLFSALSAAALLVWLRADRRVMSQAVIFWGVVTFALMTLLWVMVPHHAYDNGDNSTKLFLYDEQRGYRIYMPMFFGSLLMFSLNRSFWLRPKLWKPLALLLCFVLQLMIFKQRTAIGGTAVVVVIGAALSLPRRWRGPVLAAMVLGVLVAAPAIWAYAHSAGVQKSLGGSLTTRQDEIAKAIAFLNAQPHRWIFGAGSATRIGDVSLGDIVGARTFFLADLGWIGVAFEYGAIGVGLLLLLHWAALRITWRAAKARDPVARALFDYVFYVVLVSPILPVTFAPGEAMTCMAMAFCFIQAQDAERAEAIRELMTPS